ncbi:universal stress protein [Roseateles sp. SL47]|uniref:universal stress protein n=1 Tax=Roseateles sp. SL47 TaxID=2995138 RepID=UPI00226F2AB3|nr:universal stress protein [Roseateles sp. SL47]WAC75674.1 universal stress protein [Roseateles sp. SL47]
MTYRTVMVALDGSPASTARVDVAIGLAQDFDAHLIGVAPTGWVDPPVDPSAAASLVEYGPSAWELLIDAAEAAADEFRLRCQASRLPSFEAMADQAAVASSLADRAHCADLLVMSQPDPDQPGHRQDRAALEQVLLHSARPVLVVPYTHQGPMRWQQMLVGWDESREAVRAMTDALPLLRKAEKVLLAHWRQDPDGGRVLQRLHSMRQWLAFQGVEAQPQDLVTRLAVGEAMLSAAADSGTDLIVMGAYSHARWAEVLFGGASRTLLDAMTVPVLMSH